MFSFYGSKSKIIKKYPKPTGSKIVELFAGSARYALEYWDREITLFDLDLKVFGVWDYLINTSKDEILTLPDVPNGTRLSTIPGFDDVCIGAKYLIGFCSNGGSAQPKNVSGRHNFNSWNKDKIRIAENIHKVKEWKFNRESWESAKTLPNDTDTTWFVDPPYQKAGKWYKENKVDYDKLAEFCISRRGQVIVCENDGADWLPFKPFLEVPFTHFKTEEDKKKKTKEVIWYKEAEEC